MCGLHDIPVAEYHISLPGCFCLQFLIACSMQKWRRGKAWEKESLVLRQVDVRVDVRVDMRGAVPNHCNSQTLCWSTLSLPNNKLYWHCLSSITRRTSRFFVRHHPPHIYPHLYLTSCTWLFLRGLPPPTLHTASDQKLEAGTTLIFPPTHYLMCFYQCQKLHRDKKTKNTLWIKFCSAKRP